MIENIINTWLAGVQKDLIANYKRLGLKASGDWAKSLEPFQEVGPQKIRVGMLGNDYTQWIENGRGPNKSAQGWKIGSGKPAPEALKAWVGWAGSTFLKQWVEDKQIDISPFAVAWKIGSEGWEVPNKYNAGGLVSDVVTSERIGELNRSLVFSLVQDFKSQIIKQLK